MSSQKDKCCLVDKSQFLLQHVDGRVRTWLEHHETTHANTTKTQMSSPLVKTGCGMNSRQIDADIVCM